ncbi:Kelch repeat-containing protein [Rhodopirellula sp. MGV]|uniref:Kelch repeat-containing protein n=1 Tax=Rhodopirellula sp. MGV TaxID=2023130 RepID=UPI001E3CADF8|nr:kelch repeat-containing protein [Rhodopirellula sp. MGV]
MPLQTEAPTLEHHGGVAGAIVGNQFYVIGGMLNPFEHLDTALAISLNTESEPQSLAPLPTPRANVVAVANGTKIYTVAGGISPQSESGLPEGPSSVVEILDTTTGEWHKGADLPAQRVKPGIAAVGDTVYALGGREDKVDANTIFAYDTANDSWSLVGTLPYGARHGAACSHRGQIYYTGGWTAGPDKGTFQRGLIEFDPATNRSRPLADLPEPRTAHAMVAHDGSLYVFGGVDAQKQPTSTVFRYDIASDRWETCEPLDSVRAVFACAVHAPEGDDAQVILAGGWTQMHRQANTTQEFYRLPKKA